MNKSLSTPIAVRSMADLSEAIWSLQDELENFTHSKRERDLLHKELHDLYTERCARIGHGDGEQCPACGEWIA